MSGNNGQQIPLPGSGGDTLDQIMREWARAKIQQIDIRNYAGANMAYNHGADIANKLGLDERQKLGITPFPAPTSLSINQPMEDRTKTPGDDHSRTSDGGSRKVPAIGTLLPLVIGASLGGLGLGGAATAYLMRPKAPVPAVAPQQPNTDQENRDGEVGVTIEGFRNDD